MDERLIKALEDIIDMFERKNVDRKLIISELKWLIDQVKNM